MSSTAISTLEVITTEHAESKTSRKETRIGDAGLAFLKNLIKKVNGYCIWSTKRNRAKKKNSRKREQGCFFTGEFECRKPECSCRVTIKIQDEPSSSVHVVFSGDVKHDITELTSAKDTDGSLKQGIQDIFRENTWSCLQ